MQQVLQSKDLYKTNVSIRLKRQQLTPHFRTSTMKSYGYSCGAYVQNLQSCLMWMDPDIKQPNNYRQCATVNCSTTLHLVLHRAGQWILVPSTRAAHFIRVLHHRETQKCLDLAQFSFNGWLFRLGFSFADWSIIKPGALGWYYIKWMPVYSQGEVCSLYYRMSNSIEQNPRKCV